ncbi:MAG TPA: ATP-binding cassette domain-containing protein [Aliidongia sp.]|nr:ATP-binding cassette domain-containing protein [Aliidongia sp.]
MIALDAVGVTRAGHKLLDGVSLAFEPGRVTVIVGPNGAGKSTIVKLASGELMPSAGMVTLDGLPLPRVNARALALRRAVLAQSSDAVFGFTVRELATLGARLLGFGAPPGDHVERALHLVGLVALADRPIDRLSGGERQRAHLARVLVQLWVSAKLHGPGALLLDEPIAAQDLSQQLRVLEIARQHAATGGAVGIVLHDLNWAAHIADHLVALHRGRIYAQGAPATVLTQRMLAEVYGVDLEPGAVPDRIFLLPQLAAFRPDGSGL